MNDLAEQILNAADIRESSWDGGKYRMSLRDSVYKAAGDLYGEARSVLVDMLLTACWDEALDWAKRVRHDLPFPEEEA